MCVLLHVHVRVCVSASIQAALTVMTSHLGHVWHTAALLNDCLDSIWQQVCRHLTPLSMPIDSWNSQAPWQADNSTIPFCTGMQSINHQPGAIWPHMVTLMARGTREATPFLSHKHTTLDRWFRKQSSSSFFFFWRSLAFGFPQLLHKDIPKDATSRLPNRLLYHI